MISLYIWHVFRRISITVHLWALCRIQWYRWFRMHCSFDKCNTDLSYPFQNRKNDTPLLIFAIYILCRDSEPFAFDTCNIDINPSPSTKDKWNVPWECDHARRAESLTCYYIPCLGVTRGPLYAWTAAWNYLYWGTFLSVTGHHSSLFALSGWYQIGHFNI